MTAAVTVAVATIALCKHRVRGLTKLHVTSVLRLSSRTLSCLYTSRRPISLHYRSARPHFIRGLHYEVSCHNIASFTADIIWL